MSQIQFGPLITGDDIRIDLRNRKSKLDFKTVKASKMALILEKVAIEEKDGWDKHTKNKKSYKLSKPKPAAEQLEDELWCIVAEMGFKELSSGRFFAIETKKDPKPRQIDIFAKDEEVALVIECTQCAIPTKKDMTSLIQKIAAIKDGVSKSISVHYGRETKIKPKFIIATRNVEWRPVDIEKCDTQGISILTETEIEYYQAITKHLKSAARYQFHAHIFSGATIPALKKTIPATRGTMGGVPFYNFLIKPDDLLKISYVGHKASRTEDDIETYQRMLQPNRLKAIAKYIDEGGKFPTNIVVNIKTPRNRELVFNPHSPKGNASFGELTLPSHFGAAWIIDGQHRLYGYAYRNLKDGPKDDKSVLSVLAFENLPAKDEMDMFIDINSKQVKVQKGLLVELYADLHWNSPDPPERLLALQARIVAKLNSQKTSPIFDRVVITGKGKTSDRCLTQTSISDGIAQARLLGNIKKYLFYPGPLAHHDPNKKDLALRKATEVLSSILTLFSDALPDHWALGDRAGGYLCTNIAIRAILHVISDICNHIHLETGADLSTWNADDLVKEIEVYIQPLIAYFTSATDEEVQSFRRQGSSLAAVKKQSMGMNVFIRNSINDYGPEGLEAYLSSRDQEGNDAAVLMINKIQDRIFKYVISALKEKHGDKNDSWWLEGIPTNVRLSCSGEWEKQKRQGNVESYLYILDYQNIATADWDLFGNQFALDEKDTGNKKKCVEWIKKLSVIRNKTHHPEKGKLSQEQIKYVENIWSKVDEYFPSPEED